MNRRELIQNLQNHDVDKTTITDLFLYYLTTEERQLQMLEWIKENHETCDQTSILNEAQNILNTFLSKQPYNVVPKDTPLPKWTPPKKENRPTRPPKPPLEDVFDKVLQSFFDPFEDG